MRYDDKFFEFETHGDHLLALIKVMFQVVIEREVVGVRFWLWRRFLNRKDEHRPFFTELDSRDTGE